MAHENLGHCVGNQLAERFEQVARFSCKGLEEGGEEEKEEEEERL